MDTLNVKTHASGWSIFIGVLLIVCGIVALAAPFFAGIAASIFFGWLVLFAGVAHLVYAWSARGAGSIIWQILVGLVYLGAGIYMLLLPVGGLLTVTLVLAFYILFEGVFELAAYFQFRQQPGSVWLLIDGLISLLLAGFIFFHFPSSSLWALGTLVGISMLMSGFARLTLNMAGQRSLVTP